MELFACGGVAAACAICVVNPVDVIKSRLQMQGEMGAGTRAYSGVFSGLAHVARHEGLRGLYGGLFPAICFQMVGNSVRFGVYGLGKRLAGAGGGAKNNSRLNFACGVASGACAGLAACPFFVLKTQMQVQSTAAEGGAVGHQHGHSSMAGAVRTMWEKEGARGFFRGVDAFVPRCVALVSFQMSTYDLAKSQLTTRDFMVDGPYCHVVSSAFAAGCACIAMQPLDLVGARVMNQPFSESGAPKLYAGPLDCLRKTVQKEGILALYKGGFANYMRMGPQYILTFVFYEQMLKAIQEYRSGVR